MKSSLLLDILLVGMRAAGLFIVPAARKLAALRKDEIMMGRTGRYSLSVTSKAPYDIWLHAVSVGEVTVAETILKKLITSGNSLSPVVSSTTPAGLQQAGRRMKGVCSAIPAPLDMPAFAADALAALRPAVYATVETELWPAMLSTAQNAGISTAVINGRISDKSFPSYMKLRGLMAPLLNRLSLVCAITEKSASRFIAIGANPDKVVVCGNAKYSALAEMKLPCPASLPLRKKIGSRSVWTAGSIRSGEENHIMTAHSSVVNTLPDALLIAAPRHMKNIPKIAEACARHGLSFTLFSDSEISEKTDICIVDTIGELFNLYGVSRAAFVGGSLVPKGGQNVMEPAAWGIPVIHGPFMSNFEDAADMLQSEGGGISVRNGNELAKTVIHFISSPYDANRTGRNARKALDKSGRNAAGRQAEMLKQLLLSC